MKGFSTENGYMGYINGSYMLFASEEDYIEFFSDTESNDNWDIAA